MGKRNFPSFSSAQAVLPQISENRRDLHVMKTATEPAATQELKSEDASTSKTTQKIDLTTAE